MIFLVLAEYSRVSGRVSSMTEYVLVDKSRVASSTTTRLVLASSRVSSTRGHHYTYTLGKGWELLVQNTRKMDKNLPKKPKNAGFLMD